MADFVSLIFTLCASLFELRPDKVKNDDVTLRSAFGGPMKASDSCKIQVIIGISKLAVSKFSA